METSNLSEYLSTLAAYRQPPDRSHGQDETISDHVMHAEPHAYQSIAHDDIRLLRLEPAQLFDSPLRCDLIVVKLNATVYDAISYVWGQPHYTQPIFINEKLHWITANLANALRRVRSRSRVQSLWADYICVNQLDLVEKAAQVSIMAQVYRGARCICVHLGDTLSLAADGIEVFAALARRVREKREDEDYEVWNFEQNDAMLDEAYAEVDEDMGSTALRQFLQLPWFSRRWTFQEVVCCHVERPAIFFYHDLVTTWAHISMCIDTLRNSSLMDDQPTYQALEQLKTVDDAIKTVNNPEAWHSRLLQLLSDCHSLQCSEPIDRIFALQSCASDVQGSMVDAATAVKIHNWKTDYRQPAEMLFRNFATSLILHDRNLDLLHCAGAFSRGFDPTVSEPSWIPAWQTPRRYNPLLNVAIFRTGVVSDQHNDALPWVDGDILHCSGVISDHIITAKASLGSILEVRYLHEYLRHWGSIILDLDGVDVDDNLQETEGLLRSLVRVCSAQSAFLSIGRDFVGVAPTSQEEEAELLAELEVVNETNLEAMLDIMNTAGQWQDRRTTLLASSVCRTMEGRSIFVTAAGRLGIGPASLRIGDHIAQFLHAKTPFVVRSVPRSGSEVKQFKLIGDAFVDGLMMGEKNGTNRDSLDDIQLI